MKKAFSLSALLVAAVAGSAVLAAPRLGAQADQAGTLQYVVAPSGNEARYLVREQLVGVNFPNDAVGRTSAVTGAIVLDKAGKIVAADSKFTVDIRGLKSDQARRDGFIQGRTLETARFPTVEFVPKEFRGLTLPLPTSQPVAFELLGDLTVHGVTKPTTWQVKATPKDKGFAGTASTKFTFADFGMIKPRVAVVLSVEDEIRLECDFHVIPKS